MNKSTCKVMNLRAASFVCLFVVLILALRIEATEDTWMTRSFCPEDSVPVEDEDGSESILECKCVSPCPKRQLDCPLGQQPIKVRDAYPELPGRCCPIYECQDQEIVNYVSSSDFLSTGNCLDRETGQLRENGSSWQEVEDPCVECSCESGNRSCRSRMCRSCPHPLPRLPGECCPRCGCSPLDDCPLSGSCELDVDDNGCEICECREKKNSNNDCDPRDQDSNCHSGKVDYLEMWRRPLLMVILVLFGFLVVLILMRLKWWWFRARFSPAEKNQYYQNIPVTYEPNLLPSAYKIVPV